MPGWLALTFILMYQFIINRVMSSDVMWTKNLWTKKQQKILTLTAQHLVVVLRLKCLIYLYPICWIVKHVKGVYLYWHSQFWARGCSRCLVSVFRWSKMSLQLMLCGSGKHSWGFPQIYTPPNRISVRWHNVMNERRALQNCYEMLIKSPSKRF